MKRRLQAGHPITSTNNLYAYALLTRKSNEELRHYAQRRNLDIIDFETYAFEHFVPRSIYFSDSVHPTIEGYLAMGIFFANEILRILDNRRS